MIVYDQSVHFARGLVLNPLLCFEIGTNNKRTIYL